MKDVEPYHQPYKHNKRDTPDLFLALASAIEFMTSKLAGPDSYLVRESKCAMDKILKIRMEFYLIFLSSFRNLQTPHLSRSPSC